MNHETRTRCGCPTYKKESVLTLDGGGIRGLVSLLILQQILVFIRDEERECDQKMVVAGHQAPSANAHDKKLPLACHYFSFMFGTSTGGIIALMLGRLRMSIEDCIHTYRNLGSEIFGKRQPFHFLGGMRFLVSLGTGKQADQLITRGAGPIPKLLSIVRRALKKMTDPELVHEDLQRALDPNVYFRFNVEESLKKMKLDECIIKGEDNITFSRIEKAVNGYFNDGDVWDRAKLLAKRLVQHRRERRKPGHEWFRNLTIPGLLPDPIDNRYRSDETPNGIINLDRRGSRPEPLPGAIEMPTPMSEMPIGLMISELAPRSPIQDSTRSLPTSPTYIPYDSAITPQEEWCTPSSRILEYHQPEQERNRRDLGANGTAPTPYREDGAPPPTPDTPS
ncbi:unnamed protein product [Aureobasidium uvarum]|uniref:PNPLA domain-containing protein n=1 Tax=Aureobasidium uvarum TaxID=2773716 RepID=A0A9N8PXU8_9PEZI|nr:unnamed protein product [Aureobasidium uvarum]